MNYFRGSLYFTIVAVGLAGFLGYYNTHTLVGAGQYMFIVGVLGVLETSLSFDNAVVNAKQLGGMAPVWRHRFLTWGMVIAVFGMRVVFPLLIVGVAGHLYPWDAVSLAIKDPGEYERILTSVHAEIAAFGGAFLLMVGLRYFFDEEKDVHWVRFIEEPLAKLNALYMVESLIVLAVLGVCTYLLPGSTADKFTFFGAGVGGLAVYAVVQWLEVILGSGEEEAEDGSAAQGLPVTVAKAGIAGFIYLEILDASFSFDGVIGAFALSNYIFVIALGLGIGAMFVRSLTVMLVDKGTLAEYKYLEHGAFWAILGLAVCMFVGLFVEVPEVVTGLIGAALIGAAFVSSLRAKKAEASQVTAA